MAKPEPLPPQPSASPALAASQPTPSSSAAAAKKPAAHSGWLIQVGAYPGEREAKQRLSAVKSKAAKILTGADSFTEPIEKGGTTYYRARFAGFDKDKAEAACKYLKRNDVECVTIKN
jgi:D-alanyl-D-alanine carboxypeptidase